MAEEPESPYEEVEHTADVALWVHGADLRQLFANAAAGMFHLMCEEGPSSLEARSDVSLEAPDTESLLVDWLNELIYLSEVNQRIFGRFEIVHIDESHLRASVSGGPAISACMVIKAATFHNLQVRRDARGFTATVVFDV